MADTLLPNSNREYTFRHSPDEDLVAAKHRLDLAIECATLGVWDWDTRDDQLSWNEQMFELFGLTREEFSGRYEDFEALVHPEDRARVRAAVESSLSTGEDFAADYRIVRRSAAGVDMPRDVVRHISASGRLHSTRDGRSSRMIGVCIDVTERESAERTHRRYENLLSATEQMAGIGAWEFDPPNPDPLLSEQTKRIFGMPLSAKFDIETVISFYHAEYRPLVRRQVDRLLTHGEPLDFEARLRTMQGKDIWVRALGIAERDESGAVTRVFGSFQEITGQKETERRLREQTMMQTLLFRELDHRVRNNLSSLMALVEMTAERAASVESFAGAIRRRIEAVTRVHDLLSRSHYEAIDLREIVGVAASASASGEDQLVLAGPAVRVPPRQITAVAIVLAELLNNSLKYGALSSPEGRVSLEWIVSGEDGTAVSLRLEESGGPAVDEAPTPGTGTELIDGLARAELRGRATFDYRPEGLAVDLRIKLDREGDG